METLNRQKRANKEALMSEIKTLLGNWPESGDLGYLLRAESAVADLEALVKEMDDSCPDRLERARNWRHVGNAYADLSQKAGLEWLDEAIASYKRAEMLLAGIQNPIERMLLSYNYGNALFGRSRRNDLWTVEEAREKFAQAFEIAVREMPAAQPPIAAALEMAEQVIDVLHKRQDIFRQIAAFKRRSFAAPEPEASDAEMPDESHLFEMLIENYNEAAQIHISPDRNAMEWDRRVH
jgi:hypothetical protein